MFIGIEIMEFVFYLPSFCLLLLLFGIDMICFALLFSVDFCLKLSESVACVWERKACIKVTKVMRFRMVCSSSVCSIGFCSLLTLVLSLLLSFSFFIICAVKIDFFSFAIIIILNGLNCRFVGQNCCLVAGFLPLFSGHVLHVVCASICGHPYWAKEGVCVCYQMLVCVFLCHILRRLLSTWS